MENKDFLNEISFQRNSIQLRRVELIEVAFKNSGDIEQNEDLSFSLHRSAEIDKECVNIYLTAEIGHSNIAGFSMNIKYRGEVYSLNDISMEELENYALQNVIPMLLPYIREVSSSLIGRTELPSFMLPTLDVINYLQEMRKNED